MIPHPEPKRLGMVGRTGTIGLVRVNRATRIATYGRLCDLLHQSLFLRWRNALGDSSWTLWLSIFGAVTGGASIVISTAAAWFSRRQAVAAEGPQKPFIEVVKAEWDKEIDGWYRLEILTRNETGKTWRMTRAAVKLPRLAKIISIHNISSSDAGGRYMPMHLSLVDLSSIGNTAQPSTRVAPYGTRSDNNYVGRNDTCLEEFLVYIPLRSRRKSDIRLSISFILEDNTAIARPRYIQLERRVAPKAIRTTV